MDVSSAALLNDTDQKFSKHITKFRIEPGNAITEEDEGEYRSEFT
jgi:hypothetical protein